MRIQLYPCLVMIMLTGCKEPEARRPVHVKTKTFFDASVERNKKMLFLEENAIKNSITNDSLQFYHTATTGFWYCYRVKDSIGSYTPQKNDLVRIRYDIRTLGNDTIYTQKQLGNIDIKIGSEAIFPGLDAGIKLMKKGETINFLFPSALAYGYHGDNNKIGRNVPLQSTVSLIDIIKTPNDNILN